MINVDSNQFGIEINKFPVLLSQAWIKSEEENNEESSNDDKMTN
jgi:hypothetical protein